MATRTDFQPVIFAYLAALLAAALTLVAFGRANDWLPWDTFVSDVVATLVVFAFSRKYTNSSFYDPYWSVIPPLLALYWWWQSPASPNLLRASLVTVLVWLWAIRLTANWATYWQGLTHEDWRYPLVRQRAGKAALFADFAGIHLFPTIQVFLGCLPLYFVMFAADRSFGWLDAVATVVTFGAITIELVADLQLHAWLARREPNGIMKLGLWAWSRHPNYFGELAFWWGLMLFGLAAAPEHWPLIIPGAIAMTLMFVFASIPLLDQRSLQRRPGYAEHMRRVSALIPMPPRNI